MAAVKYVLIMALLHIGACDPVPEADPKIAVVVESLADLGSEPDSDKTISFKLETFIDSDKDYLGGESDEISCSFGGAHYSSGSILKACFELKCTEEGKWEYTGDFDDGCGNCTFGGEPLIYTFDNLKNSKPIITSNDLTGEYVMTQRGIEKPANTAFGVHGHFTDNAINICNRYTDCINGATYHEPGITITITINMAANALQVYLDGKTRLFPPHNGPVEYVFGSPAGPILVFAHDHINGGGDKCISVIGTKGLTVALCDTVTWRADASLIYPWAFIYAMPVLESTLYGLCNTWTGENQNNFTKQGGASVDSGVWQCLTGYDDIEDQEVPKLCDDVAKTWLVV